MSPDTRPPTSGIAQFEVLVFDEDGRVVDTGDSGLLADIPADRRIDGHGRFLLPGLTDAHAHVYGQGLLLVNLNLAGASSLREAVGRIGDYAGQRRTGWILGRGWNQVLWPSNAFPTALDIDAVVSDRPVWLRRIDGHAGWANSQALEIAGIDADTPDPIGWENPARCERPGDRCTDRQGHGPGRPACTDADEKDIREALTSAIDSLLALGLTGVHDAGISKTDARCTCRWPTMAHCTCAFTRC